MYFIVSICSNGEPECRRCVGYFKKFEDAELRVLNNVCDIYENGLYHYVIIEHIKEGLYQCDCNPTWYEWDEKHHGYKKIDYTPDKYKNLAFMF